MEKWAAIDIGSNTVQLLGAKIQMGSLKAKCDASRAEDGLLLFEPLFSDLRTTRLGASVHPAVLAPESIDATINALKEYREILASHGVSKVRVIATSAVRDAINKEPFTKMIRDLFNWQVEVLSGQEEARFSFLGAATPVLTSGISHILLLDIGGSSSELIRWRKGCLDAVSVDVGALRVQSAGWQADAIEKALAGIKKEKDDDMAEQVIGVGGTITTAAALLQGCCTYSRDAVEGYKLKVEDVNGLLSVLQPLSIEARRLFSPLLKQRGDIICEGLLILSAFYRLLSLLELTVSAGGVMEGCLLDLGERGLFPMNNTLQV